MTGPSPPLLLLRPPVLPLPSKRYREQLRAEKILLDKKAKAEREREAAEGKTVETKVEVRKKTLYDRVTTGWAEPLDVGKKTNRHPVEERVRRRQRRRRRRTAELYGCTALHR